MFLDYYPKLLGPVEITISSNKEMKRELTWEFVISSECLF